MGFVRIKICNDMVFPLKMNVIHAISVDFMFLQSSSWTIFLYMASVLRAYFATCIHACHMKGHTLALTK